MIQEDLEYLKKAQVSYKNNFSVGTCKQLSHANQSLLINTKFIVDSKESLNGKKISSKLSHATQTRYVSMTPSFYSIILISLSELSALNNWINKAKNRVAALMALLLILVYCFYLQKNKHSVHV